ncbi:lipoprotein signal peptidase [bacterium SCSIO 12696]|nr:lipoprotein signal peptidase [bacterium SCSIO 12696]
MNFKQALPWYLLALVVIVLDQFTKCWAVADLQRYHPVEVTSFFNLTLAYNPGAAFSLFADAGGWQRWFLASLSGAVSVALVIWIAKLSRTERLLAIALGLVLGGAVGNLYDRVVLGQVVDFLDFHWQGRHFPAFNIADSAISIGAVLLVWETLFGHRNNDEEKTSE